MKRGTPIKIDKRDKLILEMKTITKEYSLTLDKDLCCGCEICVLICPKEALSLTDAKIENGSLIEKPKIDADPDKCIYCGECVILCPYNAFKLKVNGKETIPSVDLEAFPTLIKEIEVDVKKCMPDCKLACQEGCPFKAIEVIYEKEIEVSKKENKTEGSEKERELAEPQEKKKKIEKIKKIIDVKIDKEKCTYCSKCVYDCPYNAIKVTKPIEGKISINYELMPKGFKAAADVCPTKAITYDEKKDKLKLEDKWCLFCGVCRLVSPENAIILERTRILHEYIESGAWNKALEKLISLEELAKELRIKAENKIRYWILESRVP